MTLDDTGETGIMCSGCAHRGMHHMGSRLYRCERKGCPHQGETRMLCIRDGAVFTVPIETGLAMKQEQVRHGVLVNDAGDATIWTSSPVYARRLTRKLGKPTNRGGFPHWDLPDRTLTWLPRLKTQKRQVKP